MTFRPENPQIAEQAPIQPPGGPEGGAGGENGDHDVPSKEQVLEALKNVNDPELGVNIVDLGLVYVVDIDQARGSVRIEYTLTTMGCPIGPMIESQMSQMLSAFPGVKEVDAEMVLRPPWSPEMMSEEAKAALGYF